MRLTTRLVVAIVIAVAVAFAAAGLVAVGLTRAELVDRLDAELTAAIDRQVADGSNETAPGAGRPGLRPPDRRGSSSTLDAQRFAVVVVSGEEVVSADSAGFADDDAGVPDVSVVDLDAVAGDRDSRAEPFTAPGTGDVSFRTIAARQADGIVVLGLSLADVDATIDRLVAALVTVGVLTGVVLAGVIWVVVRRQTRPIEQVAATAAVVAGGDLSVRAEVTGSGAEVQALSSTFNDMLERVERDVDQRIRTEEQLRTFVANASHELRTPVTSITGYAELYRSGALATDTDVEGAMARIEAEGTRMGRLIEDLLLLARLDRGEPGRADDVDLVEIAHAVVADATVVHPGAEIGYRGAASARLSGDGDRLHQVVANLVSNALAHGGGTPVEVAVDIDGDEVVISVTDGGPGLDGEARERVFDRFWRAEASRARDSGGSGLGLSIAAAIVEAHGGSIGVESTPGDGATFWVRLPQRKAGATSVMN